MERVAIAGLSLHQADLQGVERIQRALAAHDEPAPKALADRLGASEVVCLSTCNRYEVVYARENGHAPERDDLELLAEGFGLAPDDELRGRLFLHSGLRAARHLFRVASSLDSLVLGEDQILAQVRAAFAEAQVLGLAGPILTRLFEEAARIGKRVRTATDLSRHPVSVVSLAVAFLARRLESRVGPAPTIAVLGAGATGAHAARALLAAGLRPAYVANRTPERAAALAAEVGARALPLGDFQRGRVGVDALLAATSAPGVVLDAAALTALAARTPSRQPLLAVDLALPRDLEPPTGADVRVECIDLETLRGQADENRALRARAAAQAELLIEEQLAALQRERTASGVSGAYATVLSDARELFELELARLTRGRLAHLGPDDRAAVQRWARAAFGRLSHVPLSALKRLARADALPADDWEGCE